MTPKQSAILDAAADALVALAQVLREMKTPDSPSPEPAPGPEASKPSQSPTPSPTPAPEAAPEPAPAPEDKGEEKTTLEDLQAVGLQFLENGRRNEFKELLTSRGLKSLSSTPPELYDELIEVLRGAL